MISVIVPAWGIEAYLDKAIESLLQQDYQAVEFLLIDDASPDGCPSICDAWASTDDRVRVFHHSENRGLSAARNTGLDAARGRLIMFLDGDDIALSGFFRVPLEAVEETGADIVVFNPERIDVSGNHLDTEWTFLMKSQGVLGRDEAIIALAKGDIFDFAWNKIYRRELFRDIRFPEGEKWEDMAVSYKLFSQAKTIACIPDKLVGYRERPESLVMQDACAARIIIADRHYEAMDYLAGLGLRECAQAMEARAVEDDILFLHLASGRPRFAESFNRVRTRVLEHATQGSSLGKQQRLSLALLRVSPGLFSVAVKLWRRIRGRA